MSEVPVPRTMDLAEAASFLKMHPDTLQRKARAGIIPGAKNGKWVFLEADLASYANNNLKKET